ncbi:MAG: S1 RNA-binding domain-containing protein, partial [Myxococcota bacterium]
MTRKTPIRRRPSDTDDSSRTPVAHQAAPESSGSVEDRKGAVQAVRRVDRPDPNAVRSSSTPKVSVNLDGLEALASMDMSEIAALMDAQPQRKRLQEGQKISGVVTRVTNQEVYLDVQLKSEAILDREEVPHVQEGETLEVWIVWTNGQDIDVSTRLTGALAAGFLDEAMASKIPVEGVVGSRNTGGFTVQVGDQTGFVPASHMDRLRSADLDSFVGKTLRFLVIETGDRAVFSRRRLQEMELADRTASLWNSLQPGDLHEGIITSIQDFGLFVDIDGVEGLVPRSQLTSDREASLAETYTPGATMAVRVLRVDLEQKRVSFSADGVKAPSRPGRERAPAASAGEATFGTMANLLGA